MSSLTERIEKVLIQKNIDAVNKITDINDHFNYKDDHPKGPYDGPRVSCGQNDGYNELVYIYDTYLRDKVNKNFSQKNALEALASACFNLKNPRARTDFYNHVEEQLKCYTIFPDKLK
jgi:hypothetical protein